MYVVDNSSPTASSTQKLNNLQVLAQVNYYGTLVLNSRWYLTGGVGLGGGMYYTWLQTNIITLSPEEIRTTLSGGVLRGQAHLGLGYNAGKFVAGGELLLQEDFASQLDGVVDMQFSRMGFQLFVGYRFQAPRFLKISVKAIEHPF